ncbi:MAG: MATE family efflux transporter [Spartobacteria bacterium]|nr:MATE family efflux transporter [Spartobacteria bacterium]
MPHKIKNFDLTEGPVVRQLARMTVPMIGGMFSMLAFNLTDTWFVSRLGTVPLAAMSFTFPVVMLITSVALGLGLGVSSCISRAIGGGDHHRVQRLATDSMFLAVIIVGIFSIAGLLSIEPVFTLLGAKPHMIPMIRAYMTIWYSCVAVMIIPMVGNNAIRATGDTLTPGLIMITAALLNVILDPIMIFGWWGFPRMELQGAALATVTSRGITLLLSLSILQWRYHMIAWTLPSPGAIWRSWKSILHIGLPAAGTSLLTPVASAIITRMAAQYGVAAVAAMGAGMRIEHFSYIVPMAMGSTLIPFIGQNWGAYRKDRIAEAWRKTNIFSILYSIVFLVAAWLGAGYIAGFFSDDPAVTVIIARYMKIAFIGSCFIHIVVHTGFAFNAVAHPLAATALMGSRLLLFMLPLAFLGSHLFGLYGIFWGVVLANTLAGLLAITWFSRFLRSAQ